ncbi:hypothetical protein BH10BAC6_BH10BAC6_04400 [soil metagenome]
MRYLNGLRYVVLTTALVLMIMTSSTISISAAPVSECTCTGDTVRNVNFCINGTNYNAVVYFCETNYPLNALADGICDLRKLNRISVVSKICFPNGRPPGVTDQEIFGYMLCDILNLGCNFNNQWKTHRPALNGYYCWTIQFPKCTMTDANGCIVPCGTTCPLCRTALVWTVVDGNCVPTWSQCNQVQNCDQDCTNGTCQEPICCQ